MSGRTPWLRPRPVWALTAFSLLAFALGLRLLPSEASAATDDAEYTEFVKPFLQKNCQGCHNVDNSTAGVRVDTLDPRFPDEHVKMWENIRRRVSTGTMPPKGLPQPNDADRQHMSAWIDKGLQVARLRPAPKNGQVLRLTVAQYRNTLKELLLLEDDLAAILPPDAVSKEGFLNNRDTQQVSPLQMEAYFDIAEKALDRAIVDPTRKPVIQNFRVELGAKVNPAPLQEKLILGAGSALLDTSDVLVTELTPTKPFAFDTFHMRTKYRFIEGYRGNDTVRGWRDFDSIYHSVFADMRGSGGYPKGAAWSTVPEGLLLRPAIPTEEMFDADGTYGPKANFKIPIRELPESGRFRVTVTAAKYNDGLLLDTGATAQSGKGVVWTPSSKGDGTVTIPQPGVYQVDVHVAEPKLPAPDGSKLSEGLSGAWPSATSKLNGKAQLIDGPVGGKAVALSGGADALVVPRAALPTDDPRNVGEGDFALSAWIRPKQLQRAALVSLGSAGRDLGWFLELADARGTLRLQTAGADDNATASISSRTGAIKANVWQHIAVVVRRGRNHTELYVNGKLVGEANVGSAQFDDTHSDLQIGGLSGIRSFQGDIADVRLYRRPLEMPEIAALIQPGAQFLIATGNAGKKQTNRGQAQSNFTLTLGDRQFIGALRQPAYVVVRLPAGPLSVKAARSDESKELERIVFTPLTPDQEPAKQFLAFEKRLPRVGVHLGLRRDCGSTLAPVGPPQVVKSDKLAKYVFEGTLDNFPEPVVEKDNVNYLAGIHEIGVRSEYTDGRDMPRLVVRSVEFEGPYYESWPPPAHKNIFVDYERKTDSKAYARKIVHDFAVRAYRRPVAAPEEAALMAVFDKAQGKGRSFTDSVKDTLLVVLTSPQFLFLVETSSTPAPEPLAPHELASKLSYFLWNGPPDRRTLQLASAGTLGKELNTEVDRMVADSRFNRFANEFVSQWLSLDKFQVLEVDRKRYPKLTRDTRTALKQEPVEFIEYLIRQNLPAKNLIASDFILANEAVASYYGFPEKTESGFRYVPITHGRRDLGGLLTQAAIMAGLSDGRESNPVKRGAWLARKIVAEPPADPPPNVPALKEDEKGLTLRQRLEQHRSVPACMTCHLKIDPWGVAMEEYDAGGRRKQAQVDAKSKLPDNFEVSGAEDLKRHLAEDRIDQIAFSVLKHLSTYAAGRTLTYNELDYLKRDGLKLKASGYRMKDMVRYVVNSKIFLEK